MRGRAQGGRLRSAALVLSLASVVALAHGLWIPAKAQVAQRLIARAWERSMLGTSPPKPWPWADTGPIARLWLAPEAAPLYVLAGASGEAMAFGPAHVPERPTGRGRQRRDRGPSRHPLRRAARPRAG